MDLETKEGLTHAASRSRVRPVGRKLGRRQHVESAWVVLPQTRLDASRHTNGDDDLI